MITDRHYPTTGNRIHVPASWFGHSVGPSLCRRVRDVHKLEWVTGEIDTPMCLHCFRVMNYQTKWILEIFWEGLTATGKTGTS